MLLNCGAGEDSWESLGQKEVKPVNPKGNQPWIFIGRTDAEAPILWLLNVKRRLTGKEAGAGKDWSQKEKGAAEEEMVRWHHRLNEHEFEQTPGDSGAQRSLACCSPQGHLESDTTWRLNNNSNKYQRFTGEEKAFKSLSSYRDYTC